MGKKTLHNHKNTLKFILAVDGNEWQKKCLQFQRVHGTTSETQNRPDRRSNLIYWCNQRTKTASKLKEGNSCFWSHFGSAIRWPFLPYWIFDWISTAFFFAHSEPHDRRIQMHIVLWNSVFILHAHVCVWCLTKHAHCWHGRMHSWTHMIYSTATTHSVICAC